MSARLDTSPQTRARHIDQEADHRASTADASANNRRSNASNHTPRPVIGARAVSAKARIERAANKLKKSCTAVDILTTSLTRVAQSPTVERFRKVDVSNGVFKKEVASVDGGTELLYGVGFTPMHGHLVLQQHDPALLHFALGALENVRSSAEYKAAKAAKAEVAARAAVAAREAESARAQRVAALARVPAEPHADDSTSCCHITIQTEGGERIAKRRFDSENTLADVLNFVRSLPAVECAGGSLRLENVTTRPPRVLDLERQKATTLYGLDLWPVGHVRVMRAAA